MRRFLTTFLVAVLVLTPVLPVATHAQDQQFAEGEFVIVTDDAVSMHAEPSMNSPAVDTLSKGAELRVLDDNPVAADGFNWWLVSDETLGIVGWVVESFLESSATYVVPTATPSPVPPTPRPTSNDSDVYLDVKDLIFDPTEIVVQQRGEPLVVHLTNQGAVTHNFTINAIGIDIDVSPGATADIDIPVDTPPGVYAFYCNVPGHKEAGMAGTFVIWPDPLAQTAASDEPGCQGFTEYVKQYDASGDAVVAENPEADALFNVPIDNGGPGRTFSIDELTPDQLLLVAGFFSDAAETLALIIPPVFATPWHLLQIEQARLFADYFSTAAASGVELATLLFATRGQELTDQMDRVLTGENSCPAFLAWAYAAQFGYA